MDSSTMATADVADGGGEEEQQQQQQQRPLLVFTFPPGLSGLLGVELRQSPDDGRTCIVVASKTNAEYASPLEVGDVVESFNGTRLADVEGGVPAWVGLMASAANESATVTVLRRRRPTSAAAMAVGGGDGATTTTTATETPSSVAAANAAAVAASAASAAAAQASTSAPEPPRWRFVAEAKKSLGYSSLHAGSYIQGKTSDELGAKYAAPDVSLYAPAGERRDVLGKQGSHDLPGVTPFAKDGTEVGRLGHELPGSAPFAREGTEVGRLSANAPLGIFEESNNQVGKIRIRQAPHPDEDLFSGSFAGLPKSQSSSRTERDPFKEWNNSIELSPGNGMEHEWHDSDVRDFYSAPGSDVPEKGFGGVGKIGFRDADESGDQFVEEVQRGEREIVERTEDDGFLNDRYDDPREGALFVHRDGSITTSTDGKGFSDNSNTALTDPTVESPSERRKKRCLYLLLLLLLALVVILGVLLGRKSDDVAAAGAGSVMGGVIIPPTVIILAENKTDVPSSFPSSPPSRQASSRPSSGPSRECPLGTKALTVVVVENKHHHGDHRRGGGGGDVAVAWRIGDACSGEALSRCLPCPPGRSSGAIFLRPGYNDASVGRSSGSSDDPGAIFLRPGYNDASMGRSSGSSDDDPFGRDGSGGSSSSESSSSSSSSSESSSSSSSESSSSGSGDTTVSISVNVDVADGQSGSVDDPFVRLRRRHHADLGERSLHDLEWEELAPWSVTECLPANGEYFLEAFSLERQEQDKGSCCEFDPAASVVSYDGEVVAGGESSTSTLFFGKGGEPCRSGAPSAPPTVDPSASPSASPSSPPSTSPPTRSPVPFLGGCPMPFVPYAVSYYQVGTLVEANDIVYECIARSCRSYGFEPPGGSEDGGSSLWRQGWSVVGSCDGTMAPTGRPTASPTDDPTGVPSDLPTPGPMEPPTEEPTPGPTTPPTPGPTPWPTPGPTPLPTRQPTRRPTYRPTPEPTALCSTEQDFNVCMAVDMSGSVCNSGTGSECLECRAGALGGFLSVLFGSDCRDSWVSQDTCCNNFGRVKEFAGLMVDSLGSFPADKSFSVVQFATSAELVGGLSSAQRTAAVVAGLDYTGGLTNHAAAIDMCQRTLPYDAGRKNFMMLITDGVSSEPGFDPQGAAVAAALRAKSDGTFVVPVFISPNGNDSISLSFMRRLSSDGKVFDVSDFDSLNNLQDRLIDQVSCS